MGIIRATNNLCAKLLFGIQQWEFEIKKFKLQKWKFQHQKWKFKIQKWKFQLSVLSSLCSQIFSFDLTPKATMFCFNFKNESVRCHCVLSSNHKQPLLTNTICNTTMGALKTSYKIWTSKAEVLISRVEVLTSIFSAVSVRQDKFCPIL